MLLHFKGRKICKFFVKRKIGMWGHISVETHAEKYVLSIYTFKKLRSKSKNRGKNNDNSYSLKYIEL